MTEQTVLVGQTYAVCPICLKRLRARRVRREGGVYLERDCPEHGRFSALVWRDLLDFAKWTKHAEKIGNAGNENCPRDCGLCAAHLRDTCCVLLEVTNRCDLNTCTFCFADRAETAEDPAFEEIERQIKNLVRPGKTFLQLSGGEPTVRDDLPEIVRIARRAGCKYVQLNSNGLRLAEDEAFVRALAEAGLSFVFMQFDGTDDEIYVRLRGRPLFEVKKRAIERCAQHGIGVTLVPTLVRGVNDRRIADILRFAVANAPAVRGVHFQPVCYLGRIPDHTSSPTDDARYTLDELIAEVRDQAADLLQGAELLPSCCDHPLCGFHADFVVQEDGTLYPLHRTAAPTSDCCCADPAERNREFVGRRWERKKMTAGSRRTRKADIPDMGDMDYFLERGATHAFTITAMAFQDAGNLDLERLRSCSLHVFRDGRTIPFCANYLTPLER